MIKCYMSHKINKATFQEKDKLLRILEKFNMLCLFKSLYIEIQDEIMTCAAESHICSIFATFKLNNTELNSVCIDFHVIYSVLKNINEFNFYTQQNLLNITSGDSKFRVNTINKKFCKFDIPDVFYELNHPDIEKAFKFALIAIGDLHNNMRISSSANYTCCVATDSMRLACSQIVDYKLPDCNLSKDFTNFLIRLLHEHNNIYLTKVDNGLFLKWTDKIYSDINFVLKISDGIKHVPDTYRDIILQDQSQSIIVNAQKLKAILVKAMIFSNENHHIKFNPQDNKLSIESSSQEKGFFIDSLPAQISQKSRSFVINGKTILDILSKDLEEISLIGYSPISIPIKDYFYVFMPIEA